MKTSMRKVVLKKTFIFMLLVVIAAIPTIASAAESGSGNVVGKNIYVISDEAVDFLENHNVDLTPFKTDVYTSQSKNLANTLQEYQINLPAAYNDDILSFRQQAEIYGFNDEKIQQYIQGLVNTTPTIVKAKSSDFSIMSTPYSTRVAPEGLGYEVKSQSGYYQTTAFATIPSAQRYSGTSGYLFNTVSSPNGWGIDTGLWYGGGSGGDGWRAFYYDGTNQIAVTGIISALTGGKEVYFNTFVRADGYLETKILDASNFSNVYANFIYYVGSEGIYRSNAIFNRQITLCNDNEVFTDGSYMHHAKFTNAYLYSTSGYSQFNSTNTESTRRGAFGSNTTTRDQVTVHSYTEWYSEDISIDY